MAEEIGLFECNSLIQITIVFSGLNENGYTAYTLQNEKIRVSRIASSGMKLWMVQKSQTMYETL